MNARYLCAVAWSAFAASPRSSADLALKRRVLVGAVLVAGDAAREFLLGFARHRRNRLRRLLLGCLARRRGARRPRRSRGCSDCLRHFRLLQRGRRTRGAGRGERHENRPAGDDGATAPPWSLELVLDAHARVGDEVDGLAVTFEVRVPNFDHVLAWRNLDLLEGRRNAAPPPVDVDFAPRRHRKCKARGARGGCRRFARRRRGGRLASGGRRRRGAGWGRGFLFRCFRRRWRLGRRRPRPHSAAAGSGGTSAAVCAGALSSACGRLCAIVQTEATASERERRREQFESGDVATKALVEP